MLFIGSDLRELPCDGCGEVRSFAQPDCVDGHADGCPEWFCLDCGTAILLDPPAPVRADAATADAA